MVQSDYYFTPLLQSLIDSLPLNSNRLLRDSNFVFSAFKLKKIIV